MFAAQILTNQESLRSLASSTEYGGIKFFKKCNINPIAKNENKIIFWVFDVQKAQAFHH